MSASCNSLTTFPAAMRHEAQSPAYKAAVSSPRPLTDQRRHSGLPLHVNTTTSTPETEADKQRRIALALYHRDHLSRGRNRKIFGYEAYHWAVMIIPQRSEGNTCYCYDATDASQYDPATHRLSNPTMDWWFRVREDVVDDAYPGGNDKLVGRIIVGTVPASVSYDDLTVFFGEIPLPIKNQEPQQSCVTWAENALMSMQANGWVSAFDAKAFKDWALDYADARLGEYDTQKPDTGI